MNDLRWFETENGSWVLCPVDESGNPTGLPRKAAIVYEDWGQWVWLIMRSDNQGLEETAEQAKAAVELVLTTTSE